MVTASQTLPFNCETTLAAPEMHCRAGWRTQRRWEGLSFPAPNTNCLVDQSAGCSADRDSRQVKRTWLVAQCKFRQASLSKPAPTTSGSLRYGIARFCYFWLNLASVMMACSKATSSVFPLWKLPSIHSSKPPPRSITTCSLAHCSM